jgi:RNA polymerase sigma factor (sigma-70 family)
MESFEEVKMQYTPMIHSILRTLHIYKNKEEFFQIGLIGLWEAYERFNPQKGSFTSYAYVYMKGKMLTELKRIKKDEDHSFIATEPFFELLEDTNAAFPDEEGRILTVCQKHQLTENQTKWVIYHCYKALKTGQIAAIENVSVSAVKAWRTGALNKLRADKDILQELS